MVLSASFFLILCSENGYKAESRKETTISRFLLCKPTAYGGGFIVLFPRGVKRGCICVVLLCLHKHGPADQH